MEPETKKSDKPPNFDNRESAKSGRVAGEVATRKARGNRELPHADPLHNLLQWRRSSAANSSNRRATPSASCSSTNTTGRNLFLTSHAPSSFGRSWRATLGNRTPLALRIWSSTACLPAWALPGGRLSNLWSIATTFCVLKSCQRGCRRRNGRLLRSLLLSTIPWEKFYTANLSPKVPFLLMRGVEALAKAAVK